MIKLIELYRFFRCYLMLEISGGFPERFLNLCNREKIHLWDTFFINGSLTTKIYCNDFHKLRKIRSKSGVGIKITSKKGFSFYRRENEKRKVLAYGLVLSLIFMSLMNLFVWCIDAESSQSISKYTIIDAAEKQGLTFGSFVPTFDEGEAGRNIVNSFGGKIIWAATNIKGSKARLEIRENTADSVGEKAEEAPCNIIADFDGVIVSADVYSGTSSVSRGSTVKKGDLLVSGISENSDGSVNLHCADGKLTAFRKLVSEQNIKTSGDCEKLVEIKESLFLNVFSLSIPLSDFLPKNSKGLIEYTKLLTVDTSLLPFGYTVKAATEKIKSNYDISSVVFYVDDFTEKEYSLLKNTLISSADYSFSKEKSGCTIGAEYNCIDFIGKKSVILKEN